MESPEIIYGLYNIESFLANRYSIFLIVMQAISHLIHVVCSFKIINVNDVVYRIKINVFEIPQTNYCSGHNTFVALFIKFGVI